MLGTDLLFRKEPKELPEQKPADWRQMLSATPERNRAAEHRWRNGDILELTVLKKRPWFLVPPLTWIFQTRPRRLFELDRLGSELWKLCDGKRKVEDLVDECARRHRLTFHESRVAVTGYVSELVRRGALVLILENSEAHS